MGDPRPRSHRRPRRGGRPPRLVPLGAGRPPWHSPSGRCRPSRRRRDAEPGQGDGGRAGAAGVRERCRVPARCAHRSTIRRLRMPRSRCHWRKAAVSPLPSRRCRGSEASATDPVAGQQGGQQDECLSGAGAAEPGGRHAGTRHRRRRRGTRGADPARRTSRSRGSSAPSRRRRVPAGGRRRVSRLGSCSRPASERTAPARSRYCCRAGRAPR